MVLFLMGSMQWCAVLLYVYGIYCQHVALSV